VRRCAPGSARLAAFAWLDDWLDQARRRPLPEGVRLALAALPEDSRPADILATLPVAIGALLRRRLDAANVNEFQVLPALAAAGMTDYVAIITRFAEEGIIGEMDGVYSSWATRTPEGFEDRHIAALARVVPFLAIAIK